MLATYFQKIFLLNSRNFYSINSDHQIIFQILSLVNNCMAKVTYQVYSICICIESMVMHLEMFIETSVIFKTCIYIFNNLLTTWFLKILRKRKITSMICDLDPHIFFFLIQKYAYFVKIIM